MESKPTICYILLFLVGLVLGGILAPVLFPNRLQKAEAVTITDTLIFRDTVIESSPIYVETVRLDTVLVFSRDTVQVKLRDTVYVAVRREQKHYKGDDYEAWVSGYRPDLDSIYVFPETRYITAETISVKPRKRWGIGIQAGYGIGVSSGQVRAFPYIGAGISYNLIRF